MKKVKVCKACSSFDSKEIKAYAEKAGCKLKIGCFGKCNKKYPEYKGKFYGLIDGKLKVCDTKEEFFKHMK
ncbi:MAG: hypothetical protein ACK5MN_09190 [Lachnospiraceae bacterium]